jgi:hypothetical protein
VLRQRSFRRTRGLVDHCAAWPASTSEEVDRAQRFRCGSHASRSSDPRAPVLRAAAFIRLVEAWSSCLVCSRALRQARHLIHACYTAEVVRRLAIAAILAVALGAPVAELFDSWDQMLQAGSDTEANMVVVVLCVGVAFAIGTIAIINRIRALASSSTKRVVVLAAPREIASPLRPAPTVSPPAVLRV